VSRLYPEGNKKIHAQKGTRSEHIRGVTDGMLKARYCRKTPTDLMEPSLYTLSSSARKKY
jgi:hypothetical protein